MLRQLGELQLGDLVEVTWLDASKGILKPLRRCVSLEFLGRAFGKISKHIVLVASKWLYAQGYGQIRLHNNSGGHRENIRVITPKLMDAENVRVCQ